MAQGKTQPQGAPERIKELQTKIGEQAENATSEVEAKKALEEALKEGAQDKSGYVTGSLVRDVFFRSASYLEGDFVFDEFIKHGGSIQGLIVNEKFNEDEADALSIEAASRLKVEDDRPEAVEALIEMARFQLIVLKEETFAPMVSFLSNNRGDDNWDNVSRVVLSMDQLSTEHLKRVAEVVRGTPRETEYCQHPSSEVETWKALLDESGDIGIHAADTLARFEDALKDEDIRSALEKHLDRPAVAAGIATQTEGEEFVTLFKKLVDEKPEYASEVLEDLEAEKYRLIPQEYIIRLLRNADRDVRSKVTSKVTSMMMGR